MYELINKLMSDDLDEYIWRGETEKWNKREKFLLVNVEKLQLSW